LNCHVTELKTNCETDIISVLLSYYSNYKKPKKTKPIFVKIECPGLENMEIGSKHGTDCWTLPENAEISNPHAPRET
jgi:hypothetical protein